MNFDDFRPDLKVIKDAIVSMNDKAVSNIVGDKVYSKFTDSFQYLIKSLVLNCESSFDIFI